MDDKGKYRYYMLQTNYLFHEQILYYKLPYIIIQMSQAQHKKNIQANFHPSPHLPVCLPFLSF